MVIRIARQGWRFIGMGLAAAGTGAVLGSLGGAWGPAGRALAGAGAVFAAFCAYFFRDPERPFPADPGKIYSPGDGRVLSVAREGPGEITTLRIFLSVFDVHVQRAPCAGRVDKLHYQPGSFRAAMKREARHNERCVMTLRPEAREGPLVVEQIAGLIARRIECWPREGESLKAGERYGIIYFGSQAAVHFPASARCTARPGDRVQGGITPIGEWIGGSGRG